MKKPDISLLKKIKHFNGLQDKELEELLNNPENEVVEYPRKQTIFNDNDIGEYLYIMLDGLAEVYVRSNASFRDISIASLKPGDYFGDGAATTEGEGRHSATIKTALDSKVYRIPKKNVLKAIKGTKPAVAELTDEVQKLLLSIPIFKGLTDDEIKDAKYWAVPVRYKKDDVVHEPDMVAEKLFVVEEGEIQHYILDTNGNKHNLNKSVAGQYFGEIELLPGSNGKHYQFAVALCDSNVIHVSKKIFDALIERNDKLPVYLKQMNQLRKISRDHTEKG